MCVRLGVHVHVVGWAFIYMCYGGCSCVCVLGYVFFVCYLRLSFHCLLYEVMFSLFVICGYVFIVCYLRLCVYCLLFEVMFLLFVI